MPLGILLHPYCGLCRFTVKHVPTLSFSRIIKLFCILFHVYRDSQSVHAHIQQQQRRRKHGTKSRTHRTRIQLDAAYYSKTRFCLDNDSGGVVVLAARFLDSKMTDGGQFFTYLLFERLCLGSAATFSVRCCMGNGRTCQQNL